MTYALILYVMTVGGQKGFVIDYDLTHEDCTHLETEWKPTLIGSYAYVTCSEEPQQ